MQARLLTHGLPLLLAASALACGVSTGQSPAAAGGSGPAAGAAATGPGSVSGLSDLMGVRGSAAETQMEARGYANVGGKAQGNAVVTYWRRATDGTCVAVTTSDGRYQAIAPATAADCQASERATREVPAADAGGYRTVCGVFVDRKPIRYVCSVAGGDQRSTPTTLRFPDMAMVLHWLDGKRVRIEIEGTTPIEGTWSESEGETDLVTPEKTWFYISDRSLAAREVESMNR